jgi:hypothetical protein
VKCCDWSSDVCSSDLIHIDDGTVNNYLELGIAYTTPGFCKVVRRLCNGGVLVSTDLITGLPIDLDGLDILRSASSTNLYFFKGVYNSMLLAAASATTWVPANVGFYTSKTAAGALRVRIVRWTDNFA